MQDVAAAVFKCRDVFTLRNTVAVLHFILFNLSFLTRLSAN